MDLVSATRFESIERLLTFARQSGRRTLTEPETKAILSLAGLPVSREQMVKSSRQAVSVAREFGFPVVLKVVSPDLAHKSDAGGVHLGLESPLAVERAYHAILASVRDAAPRATIDGVLVQPQLAGLEVIIGVTTDAQFGPVIMFGLGGTAVELLGDVAFRLVPLDEKNARSMLDEVKAAPLLSGFRGSRAVNTRSILAALSRLSELMYRFSDMIQEIEINPMLVTTEGAVAVDAMAVMVAGQRA